MQRIDKRYASIVIFLLTCWIHVISQPTLGNVGNRKCQEISPEFRVLLNKLQHIDNKVNMIEIKSANMLEKLHKVEDKVNRIEINDNNMLMELQSMENKFNMIENNVNGIESEGDNMLDELQNMEDQINKTTDNIRRLDSYVSLAPVDCSDIKSTNPTSVDGFYTIILSGGVRLEVFCDMSTDGGGWLVFQRRKDGSENFFRTWVEYQHGFGRLDGEFWLGNDALHLLTMGRHYDLRVDVQDFQRNSAYALYSNFSIHNSDDFYKLSLGTYSGTAGNSLSSHSGHNFSTFDADHDSYSGNCADDRKGAWWYWKCDHSNLNGMYLGEQESGAHGVVWDGFKGSTYSLKFTEMKIRPTN